MLLWNRLKKGSVAESGGGGLNPEISAYGSTPDTVQRNKTNVKNEIAIMQSVRIFEN